MRKHFIDASILRIAPCHISTTAQGAIRSASGSKAEVSARQLQVGFTPESGHR